MAQDGISGKGLAIALAGSVLSYSALKGHKVSRTIRDLVAGKNPADNQTTDVPVNSTLMGLLNPNPSPGAQSPVLAGPNPQMTPRQIYQTATAAGFDPISAIVVTAIAFAESSGHPREVNDNPSTGDLSYGLMQINMIGNLGPARRAQFGLSSNDQLLDPLTNMRAAYVISKAGLDFSPWTTFTSGKYTQFLPAATAASHG